MAAKPTDTEAVESFLAALDHPRKAEILELRRILLDADPSIREGIKWNAPSFRVDEYFATFHLRAKDGVQLIFHRGAKVRADAIDRAIEDPSGLLEWLGTDRASLKFQDLQDVQAKKDALQAIVAQWIRTL